MRCRNCGLQSDNDVRCEHCGAHHIVSVADDRLDQMVQAASVPNLASLFKQGKDAGLIDGVNNYGEGAPKP